MNSHLIAAWKATYCKISLSHKFDSIGDNAKCLYKVDLLTAMKWPNEQRHNPSSTTFHMLWSHRFREDSKNALETIVMERDLETTTTTFIKDHSMHITRVEIKSLRNIEDDSSAIRICL